MTHLAVRMKASSEEQDNEAMRQSLPKTVSSSGKCRGNTTTTNHNHHQQRQQQQILIKFSNLLTPWRGRLSFSYMSHSLYHKKNQRLFWGGYYRQGSQRYAVISNLNQSQGAKRQTIAKDVGVASCQGFNMALKSVNAHNVRSTWVRFTKQCII